MSLSKKDTLPQLFLLCATCSIKFPYEGGKRHKYCSPACKQVAYRERKKLEQAA